MAEDHPYHFFLNGRTDGQTLLALEDVIKSGLTPEMLEKAQVQVFGSSAKILKERLGFVNFNGVSLMQSHRLTQFPYFDEDGRIVLYRYRLSPTAYRKEDNQPTKYLHPKDTPAIPYILPSVWSVKDKANKPVWITEGEKKCLKLIQHGRCCIGLTGVWLFKNGNDNDSKYLLPELKQFAWKGRTVYIGFDADLWTNPSVRAALFELSFKLFSLGAVIRFPIWQGAKGIDDFLVNQNEPGNVLTDLESRAKDLRSFASPDYHGEILGALYRTVQGSNDTTSKTLVSLAAQILKLRDKDLWNDIRRRQQVELKQNVDHTLYPYFIDDQGAVNRWKRERDGSEAPLKLANFTARIAEEITEDNGQEKSLRFAMVGGTKKVEFPKISIPVTQFTNLQWVMTEWGNDAIIEPGLQIKEYLRHFIQVYSNMKGIVQRTVFAHTGWREVKGQWQYLMANGALDDESIDVELPGDFLSMGRYCLPHTIENELEAIKASLSFLHIGKNHITYPAYAYAFLAPLTSILDPIPNFSAYFYGETGSFKSTVTTLLLSHFGNFSINNLSNFDSTANQIEKRAFVLKDTLQVLDDYHPSASHKEATAKEAIAQRLIRACSNRTGRERLRADTSERDKYFPRCMLIITGEELVELQSTLARVMVVEFNRGDVYLEQMTELQRPERRKLLPHAMSSYIRWVRDNLNRIRDSFPEQFGKLRSETIKDGHKKMNEQKAYLTFAFDLLLQWALEKGAIAENEAKIALQTGKDAFLNIAQKHSERIEQDDPVGFFFDIVDTLLTQDRVYLLNRESPSGEFRGDKARELIGYFDVNFYYFLPVAIWNVVQSYLQHEKSHFPFTKKTLYSVLEKRGYIETKDGKHSVLVNIHGVTRRYLKMRRGSNSLLPSTEGKNTDE